MCSSQTSLISIVIFKRKGPLCVEWGLRGHFLVKQNAQQISGLKSTLLDSSSSHIVRIFSKANCKIGIKSPLLSNKLVTCTDRNYVSILQSDPSIFGKFMTILEPFVYKVGIFGVAEVKNWPNLPTYSSEERQRRGEGVKSRENMLTS